MRGAIAVLALSMAWVQEPQVDWHGTVTVTGMIHEPEGYHPYTTTATLRLHEGERVRTDGALRVSLISDSSMIDVEHSLFQSDGSLVCSGSGTEELPNGTIGYLETKGRKTRYHLAIPRAFGAYACGQNRKTTANRFVIVGSGDHEPVRIETEDREVRFLVEADSVMRGVFESTKSRGAVSYEYKVEWNVVRSN